MRIKNSKLVGDDGNFVPFKKSPNVGGQLSGGKPKFLVIHYTAGGGASGTVNWFQNPSSKVSAHLVIDRNGDVTQMVPFDTIGQHAGKSRWKGIKGLNSHSIGIELCNWGLLQHAASGAWLNPAAKPVPAERVVLAAHRNSPGEVHGWEVFDGEQFDATVRAAQAIVEEYGLSPTDVVGHDDISPLRKIDPGPAFPLDRFRALVFGRAEDDWDDVLLKVRSDSGLHLRADASPGATSLKLLADGSTVHLIDKSAGTWWLVCEVLKGKDDVTGYVHSHFLEPI
jgi:N-acetylmuramoyl-L-alanine amidase